MDWSLKSCCRARANDWALAAIDWHQLGRRMGSTRASGQFSTAYGNIEDIVYAIDMVMPDGELVTLGKAPRAAAGPDLRHLALVQKAPMVWSRLSRCRYVDNWTRSFSAWYCADMACSVFAREIVRGLAAPGDATVRRLGSGAFVP